MRAGFKADDLTKPVRLYLALVCFSVVGHLLTKAARLDPGPIAPVSAAATILAGCWAAFEGYLKAVGQKAWIATGATLALGAAAELIGLRTGLPFGPYEYTGRWWPSVNLPGFGPFPLLLPIAWLLIAGGAYLSVARIGPAAPLLSAMIAAWFDYFMEPVLTGPLGYWHWHPLGPFPGGAPPMNFGGWFLVSLVAGLILRASSSKDTPSLAPAIVLAGLAVVLAALSV